MMDEETTLKGKRFWGFERKLFVLFFILGLVIGGFATNQYLDPYFFGKQGQDQNSLLEENSRLDSRSEELYNCLLENNIPPSICGAQDYNGEYRLDIK